ncbi:MAG: signal peptidase I [Oscillospiraceae bacterium]|nr:signal peptidase I [Oscillospiraceae bacterium]
MPKRRYQAAEKAVTVQRDTRPVPKKKSRIKLSGWRKEAVEWVKALAGAALVVFVLFFVLTRIVNVEGASMEPTLLAGDRLLISGVLYTPENGDIVVTSKDNALGKPLVKRIIAKGGQIVDMDEDGRLMVNGLVLDEYYLSSPETDMGDLELPLTVPDGCVFIMGDNRAHSTDSRSGVVGMIPEEELDGRVLFRFWPPYRLGTVK